MSTELVKYDQKMLQRQRFTSRFIAYELPQYGIANAEPCVRFDATHARNVPEDKYTQFSTCIGRNEVFDGLLIRAALKSSIVRDAIRVFSQRSLDGALQSLTADPRRRSLYTKEQCARIIASSARRPEFSLDAAFGDIVRLLYRSTTQPDRTSDTAEARFLHTLCDNGSFRAIRSTCVGNPTMSVLMAIKIIESSGASNEGANSVSEKMNEDDQDDQGQSTQSKSKQKKSADKDQSDDADKGDGDSDSESQEISGENDDQNKQGNQDQSDSGDSDVDFDADSDGSSNPSDHEDASSDKTESLESKLNELSGAMSGSEVGEAEEQCRAIGGTLSGDAIIDPEDDVSTLNSIIRIAERLYESSSTGSGYDSYHYKNENDFSSTSLLKTFSALGCVEGMFVSAESQSIHGDGEVVNVVPSKKLSGMLTSELINLAVPELEDIFLLRYARGELLHTERKGIGDQGRGPIVICQDISGSMATQVDIGDAGKRITVELHNLAASFALCMVKLAMRWQRSACVIPFNGGTLTHRELFIRPHGTGDSTSSITERIHNTFSVPSCGGTSFDAALQRACEVIKKEDVFENADVIFFTDGLDEASCKDAKKTLAEMGARVFALILSSSNDERQLQRLEEDNKKFFDVSVAVHYKNAQQGIERLFKAIIEESFYNEDIIRCNDDGTEDIDYV